LTAPFLDDFGSDGGKRQKRRTRMRIPICFLITTFTLISGLQGQSPLPKIDAKEVAATLKYLSSDALAGRNTPSPGLEEAAEHIRQRFEKAGLKGGAADQTFFHQYSKNGKRVALGDCKLTIHANNQETVAVPGKDFRLYKAPRAGYAPGKMIEPARMKLADAARKGLWSGRRVAKVLLVEAPEDSSLWTSCAKDSLSLGRSRGGDESAPIILVRPGLLPAGKIKVQVSTPVSQDSPIVLRNVIGLLPGTSKKDEFVLVSAHYDHIGVGIPKGKGKDAINNGADDDASGTTAVVELAELFAGLNPQMRPARSILFVCFSGEEKGLLGSKAMADSPPVDLKQIVANINIEMIGRPAKGKRNCAWVTGASRSNFDEIAEVGFKRAGIKMIEFRMAEQLYYQSDNFSFAKKKVIAHSISAGSLHKDYHQPTDEFEKIDLKHMTAIINGLAEVTREFAQRAERPVATESKSSNRRRRK
jgi:aminopeptidase YwaD